MGHTDVGAEHVRKAYELRDRVSDRERLFILFLYDRQVTGNLQKELGTIESWVQTYPRDWQAWSVWGGWGTRGTGQYEKGIQAAEEAIRLNPDLPFGYDALIVHNISLGRFAEAAAALQRAADRKLETPYFLVSRYYVAFLEGDEAGMKREIDRARGNLETEDWMSHNHALVLARSGQMRNARILWQHTIELAQQNGDREKAAIYQAAEAVCEAHFGIWDQAKELARAALELGKGRDVEYAAAFALALSGDISGSQTLAEDLAKRFPEDTPVQFEYLPTLRALFALCDKAPLDAIERLQTALPYDLAMPGTAFFAKFGGLYPAYVRGQAYLQAGRGREAAAEFQKVLDHRGIVLADPIGALAHLQLGRALRYLGRHGQGQERLSGFPHSLERCRRGHPRPPTGQGRIREALVIQCLRPSYTESRDFRTAIAGPVCTDHPSGAARVDIGQKGVAISRSPYERRVGCLRGLQMDRYMGPGEYIRSTNPSASNGRASEIFSRWICYSGSRNPGCTPSAERDYPT